MASNAGTAVIYPTGWGRYALDSPDGPVLRPGCLLTVLVSGYQLTGVVQANALGDYLQLPDGERCGLCACMRVATTTTQEEKV